jgi:hypothetical protein
MKRFSLLALACLACSSPAAPVPNATAHASIIGGTASDASQDFVIVATSSVGSGLGLYIAKGIVHAHGGRIWAESSASGATLSFTLPLTRPRSAEVSAP